jgi:hypothetical protein
MKKPIFVLFTFLFYAVALTAQQFHIEKSAEFDEPDYGWNKLLQLKNGNTFFFHSTKKEGIELVVYGKNRKIIGKRTLISKLWDVGKMKKSLIRGLYEINGEPVLFVAQADGLEPTLYRMRLNPNTGFISKEDELGSLPKVSPFAGYAVTFGGVDVSDIVIEKDPKSDCYAVIFFNGFAHDKDERIRVLHFDSTHKKINEAYYESPNGMFKYLRYIGAVVDGSKRVYLTTYGYNAARGGDELSRIIVSRLNAGEKEFKHNVLDFSEDFDETQSIMLYNHSNNKIQLLTLSLTKKKRNFLTQTTTSYYLVLLSYLDPETLSLLGVKPLVGEKVNAYGVSNIDKDYEFSGLPQQMLINGDNTTTILSETVNIEAHGNSTKTILGPIGISELSDTGAELKGYAINKRQQPEGTFPKLYISSRSKGIFSYPQKIGFSSGNVNQYLSYDYVNTEKGRYVVFNDLPVNAEKDENEEKRKTVTYVSGTNAMCYKLDEGKMEKFYLFGDPSDKNNSVFCNIEASDFNRSINTYATIIIQRDGRDKQARVAWVTFE